MIRSFFLKLPLILIATATALAASEGPRPVEFNRDIRPILSDNCFLCHGPDKNTRKAKMRLDIREDALAMKAFVPGKPDESELVKRIFTTAEEDIMPPPESTKKLSAAQKDLLKRWIAQGAVYEPHWAYTPLKRPEVPAVKERAWVATPIDAFVLKNLEDKKVQPSKEADKRTVLRRLSLDLTGLPPTENEVSAFLADKSEKAYANQVERLLASPRFGERWAVWWLDVARFADTVGYHGDQNQRIFPYRDYVINAFNNNKPFDQFTIEQLAGDLIPNPTTETRVATGFNRLNMMTREGGAQPKEYLAKYNADRVRTVAGAWLGSSMGCCECHDHKFDPFSAKDFYSMQAFFADIKQWGVYADYKYTPNPDLKGVNNEYPFYPEIPVESPYLKRRAEKLHAQIAAQCAEACKAFEADAAQRAPLEKWRVAALDFVTKNPDGWAAPRFKEQLKEAVVPAKKPAAKGKAADKKAPTEAAKEPVKTEAPKKDADDADEDVKKEAVPAGPPPKIVVTANADGSLLFAGKALKDGEEKLVLQPEAGWCSSLRLEVLPNEKNGRNITRDGNGAGPIVFSASLKAAKDGKETKLAFSFSEADQKEPKYSGGEAQVGIMAGWKPSAKNQQSKQTAIYFLDKPVQFAAGDTLIVALKSDNIGCVKISTSPFMFDTPLDTATPALKESLAITLEKLDASKKSTLLAAYTLGTSWNVDAVTKLKNLRKELYDQRGGIAWSMVTEAKEPMMIRLLPRGNWQDESGAVMEPAVPHFLPQPPNTDKHRLTRLDLAKWLVAPENPLTGRAVMNRLWKQFFGNGISLVVDDLGAQGEWPTHPELLDWLAVDFREGTRDPGAKDAWDFKRMIRQIVFSNTYKQNSSLRPEMRDADPNNRYLASQNPRRLDAEFVRDNALFIADLLDDEIGGPSAKPYQPPGYYSNIQFPSRDYAASTGIQQYRRGVYSHWQRTFLHPMLANFDAPMRDECTCTRTVSNTPQQALTLLNDPTFFEAARNFAQRILKTTSANSDDGEKLERIFQTALARPAKAQESESLKKFLLEQRRYFKANPADAAKTLKVGMSPADSTIAVDELAAWSQVCRVVLNLHETITKY